MIDSPIHDMLVRGYELAMLENLFRDEVHCDSQADQHFPDECTAHVVARSYTSCGAGVRNWCQGRLDRFHAGPYVKCRNCDVPAMMCWKIIPV